ncbi:MAG: cysteine hydrolase family protein [Egibacteraceae bacterium]
MGTRVLVVIDMLNPYEHEDAELLEKSVANVVGPLGELITRARTRSDVQLIFVNDNYGDFAATPEDIVARARSGRRPDLVQPVVPPKDCVFLTKVRHSAFYGTPLDYMLRQGDVEKVILTGQVTEQCILYSALDAYVRDFTICVPRDGVAHIDAELSEAALRMMERNMHAEIVTAARCLD